MGDESGVEGARTSEVGARRSHSTTVDAVCPLHEQDTLGLGPDIPVYGNVNTDSIEAFVPTARTRWAASGDWRSPASTIRGAAGKGKGFSSTDLAYAAWQVEGGNPHLRRPDQRALSAHDAKIWPAYASPSGSTPRR